MECAQSLFEVGELVVGAMLVSELDPPHREWDRALEDLLHYLEQHAIDTEHVRMLSITQGGSPDTRQRAGLKKAFEGRHPKVGVISAALDSPLKRGIATAIQWINPQVALFAPEQARAALTYLDLEHAAEKILEEYAALERRIRPLPVMQAVAQGLAPQAAAVRSKR